MNYQLEKYGGFMHYILRKMIDVYGYGRIEPIVKDLEQEMKIVVLLSGCEPEGKVLSNIKITCERFIKMWTCYTQGSRNIGIYGGNIHFSKLGDNEFVDKLLLDAYSVIPIGIDIIRKHRISDARKKAIHTHGVNHHNAKCDVKKIIEIRRLNKEKSLGCKKLSKMFGMHHSTIQRILNRQSYVFV